jgi:hypothetical protein
MNVDQEIRKRFGVHDGDSLPHKPRRCGRDTLAKFMGEMGFKTGAEIGVLKGDYSQVLCHYIPGVKLKLIDPWGAFGRQTTSQRAEGYFQRAKQKLVSYPEVEFIRKGSLDAVKDVPNNSLDFVYIDQMHEFDPVMMDLIQWTPKVRPGGIVAGHDYSNVYFQFGVILAVRAYTYAHNIHNWYVTDIDVHPSFFWVKQ